VANRGLWSEAHLALLVQASGHAVQRSGARPLVPFTMGRPFGMPTTVPVVRFGRSLEKFLAPRNETFYSKHLQAFSINNAFSPRNTQ
jgi:hypothetical protein